MKRFPILLLSSVVTLAAASACREDAPETTKETNRPGDGDTDPEVSLGSCPHSNDLTVCRLRDPKATKPDVGATVTLPKLVVTSGTFKIGKITLFYVADQVSNAGKYAGMAITFGSDAGVTAPKIGDVIDLEGTYKPYKGQAQVQLVKYEATGTAEPKVTDVSEAEIATGGASAAALNGSLVRVKDVKVGQTGDLPGANGAAILFSFQLDKLIVSSKLMRGADKGVVVGDGFNEITGILRVGVSGYDEGISTLNPRVPEDLKKKDSVTPPPPPVDDKATTIEAAAKTTCTKAGTSCVQAALKGLVVTAASGTRVWAQDPNDADGKYAGILLYRCETSDSQALTVGDVVDVEGSAVLYFDGLQISAGSCTKTDSGQTVKPWPVQTTDIAPTSMKENVYQNTLVKVEGPLTVTEKCVLTGGKEGDAKHPPKDLGGFMVTDAQDHPVLVTAWFSRSYSGGAPNAGVQTTCDGAPRLNDQRTVGNVFTSLTGILIPSFGRLELSPRNDADMPQ